MHTAVVRNMDIYNTHLFNVKKAKRKKKQVQCMTFVMSKARNMLFKIKSLCKWQELWCYIAWHMKMLAVFSNFA